MTRIIGFNERPSSARGSQSVRAIWSSVLVFLLSCGTPLLAQAPTCTLRGSVTDESGAVVAGVALTLTNTVTKTELRVTTDAQGWFVFPTVLPGTYTLVGVREGFAPTRMEGLVLHAAEQRSVSLQLELGQIRETVAVVTGRASTTVGKVPATLRETPRSVSVITSQRIEAQNLYTLEEAMKNTVGVTAQRIDANRLNFFARGFEIATLQLDGLPTRMDDRLFLSPDLGMYERVEVVKGPAGLLTGAGAPGGTINLVRKRPSRTFALSGELNVASWNGYRGAIDASGPLSRSGRLRGRVVGTYRDRGFVSDVAEEDSGLFYGVLEYDVTPATMLTVGAHYQRLWRRAPWTLPAYSDYRLLDVPHSTYLGADWNDERFVSAGPFAELEHRIGAWSTRVAARHSNGSYEGEQSYAWGAVDPVLKQTDLYATGFDYREQQTGLDAYAAGPFSLFNRQHQLLLGANYERFDFIHPLVDAVWDEPFGLLGSVNVFAPETSVPHPEFAESSRRTILTQQFGTYGNVGLSLSEPVTLVLGGRVSWWDTVIDETEQARRREEYNAELTPVAGLVYDVTEGSSVYASVASIFRPHDGKRNSSGVLLDPLVARQYEAGVKGELLNRRATVSLAVFRIDEQNRALEDPNAPTGTDFFVAQGKARSQGFEVELLGQVRPGWDFQGGYTFTSTKTLDASESDQFTAFSAIAPRHIFRLWTHRRFEGALDRLSIGAGIDAVSEFYNEFADGGRLTQKGYAVVAVHAAYQATERISVRLSVTNLFDQRYYQRINNINSGNILGEPRAVALTLRLTR